MVRIMTFKEGPVMVHIEDLLVKRIELLQAAQAKVPGVRFSVNPLPRDEESACVALIAEINELTEFVNRPTPGLHTDTYDESADGEPSDGDARQF